MRGGKACCLMDTLGFDELWVAHQPGGSNAKAGFSSV